jgi:hypothetical protein
MARRVAARAAAPFSKRGSGFLAKRNGTKRKSLTEIWIQTMQFGSPIPLNHFLVTETVFKGFRGSRCKYSAKNRQHLPRSWRMAKYSRLNCAQVFHFSAKNC